jgi:hypothetical protein
MDILENEQIAIYLGENKNIYIPEEAFEALNLILESRRLHDEKGMYDSVVKMVSSLHRVMYDDMLRFHVRNTYLPSTISVLEASHAHEEKFEPAYNQFKTHFGVERIFFSPDGFLGFSYNNGTATILQIAEPDSDLLDDDFQTTTYYRRDPGQWIGRRYMNRNQEFTMYVKFGPLGAQFARHIDSKENMS